MAFPDFFIDFKKSEKSVSSIADFFQKQLLSLKSQELVLIINALGTSDFSEGYF